MSDINQDPESGKTAMILYRVSTCSILIKKRGSSEQLTLILAIDSTKKESYDFRDTHSQTNRAPAI